MLKGANAERIIEKRSRFEGFNSAGVLNARCLLALAPLLNRIEQHPVMEPLSF